MKILQVNCVYQKGSTGKIVCDVHKCLQAEGVESVVCYGRGEIIYEPHVYKFCSEMESKFYHLLNKFGWLMYAVCPLATRHLINVIRKEQPDVVHLHCINGYCVDIYKLLKFLGLSNIKTIVTHHAEFFYTGSCGHAYDCERFQQEPGCYSCPILREATGNSRFDRTNTAWRKMKNAFSYFKPENIIFTAVSPWVVSRSQLSPLCNQFICKWVTNGIETSIFKPATINEVTEIRARLPHTDGKIVLHVSASFNTQKSHIKGGYYIKQLAEEMPQHLFVVVASVIGNVEGLPKNVYVWGRSNGQKELAALYTAADITIIASKRETFSMIVAESLSCGTPVAGFLAGGPESIALPDYTQFVEYGNIQKLRSVVEELLHNKYNAAVISQKAHEKYSKETMTQGYIKVYKELTDGKQ
jgi:glycosyltransferase involved in cell wall biosynthesis